MTVLIILGVLFASLVIIIPFIEKSSMRVSDEQAAKLSKWIWPLMGIALVAAMLKAFL